MTTQTIETAPRVTGISSQAPAAEALVALINMFGHLPTPYIVIHSGTSELFLQLDSPSAFEAWRAALQIAPSGVEIRSNGHESWLKTWGVFRGVPVQLTGFGLSVQAVAS
ncbi:hypothetical protein [Streptomyces sp. PR69]|uniref:hypothetical protein n=1 Tax=Streptomyces sp. PR69 TaxID=2984950 RepID=UPI002263EB73|nr:hypothetical protein [Streptomyces sp. PR69]